MFIIRTKNILNKTAISCLLLAFIFGCSSNSENYKEKIKLALDNYEQITKDYDSYMRQMAKDNPGRISPQSELNSAKNTCLRLSGINISETPHDFQAALKKRISIECGGLNSPSDRVTYEGDQKTKMLNSTLSELEEISAKYGYVYKHSKSAK